MADPLLIRRRRRYLPTSFIATPEAMTRLRKTALDMALHRYNRENRTALTFEDVWAAMRHHNLKPDVEEMQSWINAYYKAPQIFLNNGCGVCGARNVQVYRWSPMCLHSACWKCIDSLVTDSVLAQPLQKMTCPNCTPALLCDPRNILEALNFSKIAKIAASRLINDFISVSDQAPMHECPQCHYSSHGSPDPNAYSIRCCNVNCALEFCRLCRKPYHYDRPCAQIQTDQWRLHSRPPECVKTMSELQCPLNPCTDPSHDHYPLCNTYCDNCGRVWDGNSQCPCSLFDMESQQ